MRGWCLTPGTQCTGNTFSGPVITDSGGKAFLVNNETCTNNIINSVRFQDNLQDGLSDMEQMMLTQSLENRGNFGTRPLHSQCFVRTLRAT
ncbi:MAG: hypothetical protein JWR26_1682 [Pedosphaera sp.]|nr:hypothetical protein [Pedosphaera sp.]